MVGCGAERFGTDPFRVQIKVMCVWVMSGTVVFDRVRGRFAHYNRCAEVWPGQVWNSSVFQRYGEVLNC